MSVPVRNKLRDNSWIKKPDEEDEDVDRDPNFGKSILSRYKSSDSPGRYTGGTDDLISSTTTSKVSSYKSSTITTDQQVTITTSQSLRSSLKSPTKTETFSERVQSSSKGQQYATYSPTRNIKVTEIIKSSDNTVDDSLFPSIKGGSSITTETYTLKSSSDSADDFDKLSWDDSKTVTVTRSTNGDSFKSTTSTRTLSTAEDELYDTLLPKAITSSPVSPSVRRDFITDKRTILVESPPSPSFTRTTSYSSYSDDTDSFTNSSKPSSLIDDYTSERKSYSYSRPSSTYEYSSITSPTDYSSMSSTTYRSRSEDTEPVYSKSSTSSLYSPRPVLEKDLCTNCRKPFTGDAKIILEDMRINCHASCFKCEVCNKLLDHLKAGDSMWIYNQMVHCETCFEKTRDKWRR
ncbi:sciellin isoform 2-T2 [Synchiropus picturatus]